jgi:hypothetical protein
MREQNTGFQILTCSRGRVIHAGRWRSTPHSVAVRYKDREVSMSVLDPTANAKATARLLLAELIAEGQQSGAEQSSF